jgi:hypothetical protein
MRSSEGALMATKVNSKPQTPAQELNTIINWRLVPAQASLNVAWRSKAVPHHIRGQLATLFVKLRGIVNGLKRYQISDARMTLFVTGEPIRPVYNKERKMK